MKRMLLTGFLVMFFFLIVSPVYGGLVPCGLSKDDPDQPGDQTVSCKLCHLFVMFDNIIDFFLLPPPAGGGIVPAIAVIIIAIGGFMYILAYAGVGEGGPEMLSRAKSLFKSVALGLLIIYGAWLIINTFLWAIGVDSWTGLREGWWIINCP
jgi:hypothetical protein